MQLRFECHLTGADYVTQQGWLSATLPCCPLHPEGGCGFTRHGTYERVSPPGTRVARWYCPTGHRTFSLLPDCLAARLSGTLAEVEAMVCAAEQAPSLEGLCAQQRLDIELPGALRWVRRRVQDVHGALHRSKGVLGEPFANVAPTVTAFADHLEVEQVLVALRGIAAPVLAQLPKPLGFAPRRRPGAVRSPASNTVRGRTRRDARRRVRRAGKPPAGCGACTHERFPHRPSPRHRPVSLQAGELWMSDVMHGPAVATRGMPRKVNRLAHYALTGAALEQARQVTAEHVHTAREEVAP